MQQPSIYPFGIRIDEPVTTLTDLVIAAICFYAFFALRKKKGTHKVYYLIQGYFLCIGFSTLLGGLIGHGFLYAFTPQWKFPGWAISMVGINLIERVMLSFSKSFIRPGYARFFSMVNIVELLVFAYLTFTTLNFAYVEIHTAYGLMIFVLGFSLYHYFKGNHSEMMRYFIWAVFAVIVAFFFFATKIGLGIWFNYMDISHVFLALSAWLFYKGAAVMLEKL
ncbi:hypothetical protein KUV50_17420 [Membranicola marinus]|uniref:Uncharacterized protein n=1 Tax=Membranihabitans marinus TaxID=1227546 RepID=A0A953LCW6_9BACT|nr:hypothetical protein [Membranihabitans marinus]MBY5959936.1 hypothetical protein [Membranihabitans marinus]